MIPKRLTPSIIAYAHERRTLGDTWGEIADKIGYRYQKIWHVRTLAKHYNYAMKHGFDAWYHY